MLKTRLIAVIIVRQGQVVQSVQFKHTNVIHYDACHAVEAFNSWDIDELIVLNVSRKSETRSEFLEVVSQISKYCFVPLSVGGWISNADYATELLRCGADKLVLNSAIVQQPELVRTLSDKFGAQCIVGSLDIKPDVDGKKCVWIDRGRQQTSLTALTWLEQAQSLGIGEVFFNSIMHDGARRGYDLATLQEICQIASVPVIAFGGVFAWQDLLDGINVGADAVAAANIFHYTELSTKKAKQFLNEHGVMVRLKSDVIQF